MKEFMFIFLGADYETLELSPDELQTQMQKWFAWVDKLRAEDIYVEGRALKSSAIRREEDNVITDGPFAEAKELVGGYFIVRTDSFESAVGLTSDYPDYHLGGSVEVREIMDYSQ